jgi:COP9 signalosome complex subunit 5
MGLLLGRPDPLTPQTLIVTDVFPLPIEGFETRVIADDQDVVNHMIALSDSLENTRKERFMGWYHSHPFDLGPNSHCFLSQTDITTQLQWQRSEDPHGNPFLAMVVDPLRSAHKDIPEIKAFRVYPPEYNAPTSNECPDGSVISEEKLRLEKWGSCWSRYYELQVEYFMSKSARNVMEILTQNLWMRNLGTTASLQIENRQAYPETLDAVTDRFKKVDVPGFTAGMQNRGAMAASGTGSNNGENSEGAMANAREVEKIGNACDGVVEIVTEKIYEGITQAAKKDLFAWSLLWSWCTLCSTGTSTSVYRILYDWDTCLYAFGYFLYYNFENRLQIIYHSYHQITNSDVRTTLQNITAIEQSW